jgi:hypothetical protein
MTLAIPTPVVETGPANSVTDQESGSRYYIHPITQERFVSVTTVLGMVAKEALPYWAAKVVQEKAMDMMPLLVKSLRHRPCEMKGDDRCGACRDCVGLELRREPDRQRDEAADRGTRVHKVAEHYALHGEIRPHDADIVEHVKNWQRWHRDFEVTFDAAEVTVINRTYGYAGTLDGVIRCGWMPPKWRTAKKGCEDLRGVPLFEDLKTGKGVYDEFAWQISAYRHGEAVLLPDGTELPLPEAHSEIGLVVHVRADDYWVRPAMVSDRSFGTFLKILGIYRDLEEHGSELVGRAMYKPREAAADTTDET